MTKSTTKKFLRIFFWCKSWGGEGEGEGGGWVIGSLAFSNLVISSTVQLNCLYYPAVLFSNENLEMDVGLHGLGVPRTKVH